MGSSILQAILGGVAGGASGIAEVREARRLEEERKAQAERQARADRLAYISAGFAPEAQAGRMDMPGATPRKPFMTETLPSGERMVMQESPEQTAHRQQMQAYRAKRGPERAEEERRRAAIDAAFNALSPEEQERIRPFMTMGQLGIPANVQQQMLPQRMTPYQEAQIDIQRQRLAMERQRGVGAGRAAQAQRLPALSAGEQEKSAAGMDWLRSLNPGAEQAAAMRAIGTTFANMPQLKGKGGLAAYYAMPEQLRQRAEMTPAQRAQVGRFEEVATPEAKQEQRAARWDAIKAQSPTLTDDQVTDRVLREIP